MADSEERREGEEEGEDCKTGSKEHNPGAAGSDCATLIRNSMNTCAGMKNRSGVRGGLGRNANICKGAYWLWHGYEREEEGRC